MKTFKSLFIVIAFLFIMHSNEVNCTKNASSNAITPAQINGQTLRFTSTNLFDSTFTELTVRNSQRFKIDQSVAVVASRIDVKGANFSDKMWFFVDPGCTNGFDNGWDGLKIFGDPAVTQIFGIEQNNAFYQINAKSDIHNSLIGFRPGNDRSFQMKFTHQGISNFCTSLYLVDMVANKTIDVFTSGTLYDFTSTSNDPVERFKIVTNTGVTTGSTLVEFENNTDVFVMNKKLIVNNRNDINTEIKVFDRLGRCISIQKVDANSQEILNADLTQGVYFLCFNINSKLFTKKVFMN
jgi:hypothetical protein